MSDDILYHIALTKVPNIGDVVARSLLGIYGTAKSIFEAPIRHLEKAEGMGYIRSRSLKAFKEFTVCEKEIAFIEKYKIQPLTLNDKAYPKRLLNCYDAPTLLYYKGNGDLNQARILSVVGTRNYSEYGKHTCERFIEGLKDSNVLVLSGLAFGIDTIAHKHAIKNGLCTVGVLAHGLDRIYPPENKSLAKHMTENGGLLTEFVSNTNPDRENFPKRNRIVAGMCDALLVIETGKKGGSLITADLANSYNRDVFAIPGKISEQKSEGCNYLIKNNKAVLVTSVDDILINMNWIEQPATKVKKQRELFIELTTDETKIIEVLREKEQVSIDDLYTLSGMNGSTIASVLLMLEMNGLIATLPGKMYKLL